MNFPPYENPFKQRQRVFAVDMLMHKIGHGYVHHTDGVMVYWVPDGKGDNEFVEAHVGSIFRETPQPTPVAENGQFVNYELKVPDCQDRNTALYIWIYKHTPEFQITVSGRYQTEEEFAMLEEMMYVAQGFVREQMKNWKAAE